MSFCFPFPFFLVKKNKKTENFKKKLPHLGSSGLDQIDVPLRVRSGIRRSAPNRRDHQIHLFDLSKGFFNVFFRSRVASHDDGHHLFNLASAHVRPLQHPDPRTGVLQAASDRECDAAATGDEDRGVVRVDVSCFEGLERR